MLMLLQRRRDGSKYSIDKIVQGHVVVGVPLLEDDISEKKNLPSSVGLCGELATLAGFLCRCFVSRRECHYVN